jgi:hypothetical protein
MTTFFLPILQSVAHDLFDVYDSFQVNEISSSRFTQAEMRRWLDPLVDQVPLKKSILGASSERRDIMLYSAGKGVTKVMLWSQMHGDEPTATMALLDIFKFLAKNPEHTVSKTILEKLTLLVIPMINPDGAERFKRRTAQMIDMNRDAQALTTPESRILKRTRDQYKPDYGFNLHDQDPRYTVGTTKKITAIALLAPSADESRGNTSERIWAKQIASTLAQVLNLFIPDNLAKWDDTYIPTAFGDNFQKWGTSTILVESGGWRGDPDKFFLRKLNCIGLLATLYAIAMGEIDNADVSLYDQIPFNMKLGCDTIIRNAILKVNNQILPALVDIGINFDRRINYLSGKVDDIATIVEIGDLSTYTALENEINANGAELDSSRIVLENPFAKAEMDLLFKRT